MKNGSKLNGAGKLNGAAKHAPVNIRARYQVNCIVEGELGLKTERFFLVYAADIDEAFDKVRKFPGVKSASIPILVGHYDPDGNRVVDYVD